MDTEWAKKLSEWKLAKAECDAILADSEEAQAKLEEQQRAVAAIQQEIEQALAITTPSAKDISELPAYLADRLKELPPREKLLTLSAAIDLLGQAKLEGWEGLYRPPPPVRVGLGSLFNRLQAANLSRFTIGQAPNALGGYYNYYTVLPGDVADVGGCRTEAVASLPELIQKEGQVRRYVWKTVFPKSRFTAPTNSSLWMVWTQWHQRAGIPIPPDPFSSPPIAFERHANTLRARVMSDRPDQKIIWQATAIPDHEYACDITIGASKDPRKGFVQLFIDGREVCPVTAGRTMLDEDLYFKQGLYRHPSITFAQTVGHRETAIIIPTT